MRFIVILTALVVILTAVPCIAGMRVGIGGRGDFGVTKELDRTDAGELSLAANVTYAWRHILFGFEQTGMASVPTGLGAAWIVKGSAGDPDAYVGLKATTRWLDDGGRVGFGPQAGILIAGKYQVGFDVMWYPVDNEVRVAFTNAGVFEPNW